jgi:hypothetical protein
LLGIVQDLGAPSPESAEADLIARLAVLKV